jgi:hypothetical protein
MSVVVKEKNGNLVKNSKKSLLSSTKSTLSPKKSLISNLKDYKMEINRGNEEMERVITKKKKQ